MIVDAYMHMEEAYPVEVLKEWDIACIANAATPEEYKNLRKLQEKNPFLWISAGIHPWKMNEVHWDTVLPILEEVGIIGEIGLDTVWCDTDMTLQSRLSEQQLAFAQRYQKPVILHLKGREKGTLEYLRHCENRYLVHWCSCDAWLQEYTDLGCRFTVGPSLPFGEVVQHMVACVPLDRMLVETDGISTRTWCENHRVAPKEHGAILEHNIRRTSEIRNISHEKLQEQMVFNCEKFIGQRFPSQ